MSVLPRALVTVLGLVSATALGQVPGVGAAAVEPADPSDLDCPGCPLPATPVGHHTRVMTPGGPVHVYRPAGFAPATAGTVIYVHGYYTDVDQAWRDHALQAQFASSGCNALFLVPEAPRGDAEPVRWTNLDELLDEVSKAGDLEIPSGPLVVVAHSGGFRSLQAWLDSGKVDGVVLLDGLYGAEADLSRWLEHGGNHLCSLVLVGSETSHRIERFVEGRSDCEVWTSIPPRDELEPPRTGRILFVRSQLGHMQMVTEGQVIPSLLRLTPLKQSAGGDSD